MEDPTPASSSETSTERSMTEPSDASHRRPDPGLVTRRLRHERVVSAATLLVGLGVTVRSCQLQHGDLDNMGPGTLPLVLGLFLLGLSTVLLVRPDLSGIEKAEPFLSVKVVGLFGSLGLFVGMLSYFGFIVASIVFGLIFLIGVCRESWWKATIYVVALTLICFALFDSLLDVPLPRWSL